MATTLEDIDAARSRWPEWYPPNPTVIDVNWTYDGERHIRALNPLEVIVMGFNPGAGKRAKEGQISPSERAWKTRCNHLTEGFCDDFVLAELIPQPSSNQGELRMEHGDLHQALVAGADVNHAVIQHHRPRLKLIFQVGIGGLDEVSDLYGLKFQHEGFRPKQTGQILFKHYQMKDNGIPWIALRHFNSRGFSNLDRCAVREFAKTIVPDPAKPTQ
jgi:hypothetical protein